MVDGVKINNPNNPQNYTITKGAPAIDFNSNGASYINGLMNDLSKGKYAEFWVYAKNMLLRDARLLGEFGKRNRAVLGEWSLEPPKDAKAKEKKIAAIIEEIIKSIDNFEDVQVDLNSGFYYSLSISEYNDGEGNAWIEDNGYWRPAGFKPLEGWKVGAVDPKDNGYQSMKPMLLDKDAKPTIEFEPYKWIVHTHKTISGGDCFSGGLASSLIWTFLLKWFPLKDWVGMLEKYGVDKMVATYSNSIDPTTTEGSQIIANINLALQDIRRFGAGAIPNSVDFKFLNSTGARSDAFERLVYYCDQSYAIAINGGVMTSIAAANGLGSGAAETQNEVRLEIIEADRRQLESTFTQQLVKPIMLLNFPEIPLSRAPRFKYKKDEVLSANQPNKTKRAATTNADQVGGTDTVQ